ncbi:hypothetical protein [Glutamicibacter sp. NPDC090743]|uniref:hypothetical protein n=1 Tax=Glutamicibacter sp. NPDC090743 TaxID=3364001 RepID=UPI00380C2F74
MTHWQLGSYRCFSHELALNSGRAQRQRHGHVHDWPGLAGWVRQVSPVMKIRGKGSITDCRHDGAREVIAGLSVSIPPVRFREMVEAGLPASVFAARDRIEADLKDFTAGG